MCRSVFGFEPHIKACAPGLGSIFFLSSLLGEYWLPPSKNKKKNKICHHPAPHGQQTRDRLRSRSVYSLGLGLGSRVWGGGGKEGAFCAQGPPVLACLLACLLACALFYVCVSRVCVCARAGAVRIAMREDTLFYPSKCPHCVFTRRGAACGACSGGHGSKPQAPIGAQEQRRSIRIDASFSTVCVRAS